LSGRTDDRCRSGDGCSERVDIAVVYKVDRLTRSLADFTRLVETLDAQALSIVSVTQQFNTTTSIDG
jgi:site-specific DNA recombinase